MCKALNAHRSTGSQGRVAPKFFRDLLVGLSLVSKHDALVLAPAFLNEARHWHTLARCRGDRVPVAMPNTRSACHMTSAMELLSRPHASIPAGNFNLLPSFGLHTHAQRRRRLACRQQAVPRSNVIIVRSGCCSTLRFYVHEARTDGHRGCLALVHVAKQTDTREHTHAISTVGFRVDLQSQLT